MKQVNICVESTVGRCIVLLLLIGFSANGRQMTAAYRSSASEAGLFFINPSCLNPAKGGGALSVFANPAGLISVQKREVVTTINLGCSSSAIFGIGLKDWNNYSSARIETEASITEIGGLGSVGVALRKGNWRFGAAILQPRRAGIRFQIQGKTFLQTQFEFENAITRRDFHSLPVDSLPVLWNVNGTAELSLQGEPIELMLAALPTAVAVSYGSRHFALGLGLFYTSFGSGNQAGSYRADLTARGMISGSPQGNDPITGTPWRGNISAELELYDSPLFAGYRFDVRGKKYGLSCGALMDYKLFSIGFSYIYQFSTTLKGSYEFITIATRGMPRESRLSNVQLDFSNAPEIGGNVKLRLADFSKDTLTTRASNSFRMGETHTLAFGLNFLIFGIFTNIDVPTSNPNLMTNQLGIYTNFSLPKLPIQVNLGYLQAINAVLNGSGAVPYRVMAHLGGGISAPLSFQRRLGLNGVNSRLRLGVRSSLTSFALKIIEERAIQKEEKKLPSPWRNLAFSFGLETSF